MAAQLFTLHQDDSAGMEIQLLDGTTVVANAKGDIPNVASMNVPALIYMGFVVAGAAYSTPIATQAR